MRQVDRVEINAANASWPVQLDRCTQYELSRDLTGPSEARFELGDDGAFGDLKRVLEHGAKYLVTVNRKPWVTGRLLTRAVAASAGGGSTIQLTVRSRLADAMFASCDPKLVVAKLQLKALIVDAYATLGLTERDLLFIDVTDRDVLTGAVARGEAAVPGEKRGQFKVMFPEEAKVHAPESVYQYTERHLNRFGLTQWDLPDGRIAIGAPNDRQAPAYRFRCLRGAGRNQGNNVLNVQRQEDYEQVPEELFLAGFGSGFNVNFAAVKSTVKDPLLQQVKPGLRRRVIVADGGIWSQGMADSRARKEMAARSRQKDAYVLEVDGWSQDGTVFDVNTVADIHVDTAGVPSGPHLVWRAELSGSASNGHTARLSTVAQGIWRLS